MKAVKCQEVPEEHVYGPSIERDMVNDDAEKPRGGILSAIQPHSKRLVARQIKRAMHVTPKRSVERHRIDYSGDVKIHRCISHVLHDLVGGSIGRFAKHGPKNLVAIDEVCDAASK